ncbi:MAG: TSUP family transporter [bacterium]
MTVIPYLILGLIAGICSGVLGVGGGIIMIPALVIIFGYNQHLAQGTVLATMVPPIGLLAAFEYYRYGNVKIAIAVFLCIGFFFGAFGGSKIAHLIPASILKKIFGVVLLVLSLRLIFKG